MSLPRVLSLHVAETGCVWHGDDRLGNHPTPWTAAEYVAMTDLLGRSVRVLGLRSNAVLISALGNRTGSVILGSPAICPTLALRLRPAMVLQCLRQPEISSQRVSLWHEMDDTDTAIYAFIDAWTRSCPSTATRAVRHPAWTALSFLINTADRPLIDLEAAYELLATIVDPRWYRHPFRPNRMSQLYAYLGINPQNVKAFLGLGAPTRHFERAKVAIRVWRNAEIPPARKAADPACFLWRICHAEPDIVSGVLKTTKKLVDFLCYGWTHGQSDEGFDSTMLLPDEDRAFVRHRTALFYDDGSASKRA